MTAIKIYKFHQKKSENKSKSITKQPSEILFTMSVSVTQVRQEEKIFQGIDIAFENITYTVQVEDKKSSSLPCSKQFIDKSILKGIQGIFKAGEVSAIMGASGAGKTTLLNMLACRIQRSETCHMFANNTEYSYQNFGDFANYVMQTDVLMQTMTVRETLDFAAKLKLNLSEEAKTIKINALTKKLKLEKCLDVLVGGPLIKGISGGQKKRTSIAFELISDPQVILLDQPTSGLDSLTSYIIVTYLRDLAHEQKKTVIMTIHQPSTDIFMNFDNLMLLVDGLCIYQGPATNSVEYFSSNFGLKCPEFHNPSDYFMSLMHPEAVKNVEMYPKYFQNYEKKLKPSITAAIASRGNTAIEKRVVEVPIFTSYSTLIMRDFRNTLRNPMLIKSRLFQTILLSIYVGGMFFNASGNGDYLNLSKWRSTIGFLFFYSINTMMLSLSPVSLVFPLERQVFLKEESSRLYSVSAYFISRNVIEIPYLLILPMIGTLIIYWFVGLANTPEQYFTFFLISFLLAFAGNSLGLLIGSVVADAKTVGALLNFALTPFVMYSGFYKNSGSIPNWIGWVQYISPIKYSFISYTTNEVAYATQSPVSKLNFDLNMWESIGILFALAMFFRLCSLFFLWKLRTKME